MILVTKSKKKVIGLEGYNLSITKQEIIWKFVLLFLITIKLFQKTY